VTQFDQEQKYQELNYQELTILPVTVLLLPGSSVLPPIKTPKSAIIIVKISIRK
jgi:hypothetical protein